jgi:AAA15 family ATPase/GTPase
VFESIRLVNFKSFTDVIFDFAQKNNNRPKNLVSIYGENGSGKTNIVDSFKILKFSSFCFCFSNRITASTNCSGFMGFNK